MKKVLLQQERNLFFLIFILYIFITFIGLPIDLIDPDAALYATISKTIVENSDAINLYSLGHDWLDKPHFPFWVTALSFKIFGVSNWAYKLPAILTFFFGIWMTFKFAQKNYSTRVACFSAIILAISTHSVISNFDVRAEPYLTTFIIASIYFFDSFIKKNSFKSLLFACVFCSLAIMTKGIFSLIPIAAALGGELVIKRNWKQLFHPIWIIAFLLIFLFIMPELIALYLQFDLHPEKVIFNRTEVSGIQFFFWDSQFGRFFNTAPIKGSGDIFFFFHTILWAFLPWGIIFYFASFLKVKRNFLKIQVSEEFYTFFGSVITIIIFSLSQFQLAHYTNIIFPFISILVADFIVRLNSIYHKYQLSIKFVFGFQNIIILFIILSLHYFLKPNFNIIIIPIIIFASFIIWKIYYAEISKIMSVTLLSATIFLVCYGYLFTHFYPTIIQFQGGKSAATFVNKNFDGKARLLDNKYHHFGFEFYLDTPLKRVDTLQIHKEKGNVFYLDKTELEVFKRKNIDYRITKEISNFQISRLSFQFLSENTRNQALETRFLVLINH
ncbi:glycosyltransferase family 39 protein [Polaribacter sp. BAL334]|uniref:ArnT family glycosyltransferase n=1 Tax=Polaribacter sp. BAL334 TaxID=1708178 RepID=UPI0018D1FE54|nr:glycosyltransferase family 39 protein [Polaribacter sp. BAL334]MBG7613358.1 glycosyltransferase family 39 protein [Polaribacter sp. BAL334]